MICKRVITMMKSVNTLLLLMLLFSFFSCFNKTAEDEIKQRVIHTNNCDVPLKVSNELTLVSAYYENHIVSFSCVLDENICSFPDAEIMKEKLLNHLITNDRLWVETVHLCIEAGVSIRWGIKGSISHQTTEVYYSPHELQKSFKF